MELEGLEQRTATSRSPSLSRGYCTCIILYIDLYLIGECFMDQRAASFVGERSEGRERREEREEGANGTPMATGKMLMHVIRTFVNKSRLK